jgi:hypothetical protein
MQKTNPLPILSLLAAVLASGCSSPSLYGLEGLHRSSFDTKLVGTWKEESEDDATYRLTAGKDGTYDIIVHDDEDGETKTMHLEGVLVELDGGTILDVTLAEDEVRDLGKRYALLALPVHQFIRVQRADDGYQVSMLDPDWTEDLPGTVEMKDHAVLVTKPERLVRLLEAALRDAHAWTDPGLLKRVGD